MMLTEGSKEFKKNKISTDIISLPEKQTVSSFSQLVSVTKKGLMFRSDKKSLLIPEKDISNFLNHNVELFLSQYELLFHGVIRKIIPLKKNQIHIFIDFSEDTPLYYRECIEDLLN